MQIRTAFPPPAVPSDSEPASPNVFSTLPAYEVFGSAFDYSYLLSAFATGLYLWIDERVNGSGSIKTGRVTKYTHNQVLSIERHLDTL